VRFGAPGPKGAPPATGAGRALAGALDSATDAFRKADVYLEDAGVLAKLEPAPEPAPAGPPGANGVSRGVSDVRARLQSLALDDDAVWARERVRQSSPDAPPAPWPVKVAYLSLCWVLDGLYAGRPIQRFWFLETVARMPYFSYISMLHLYESLGWWRAGAGLRRVHWAEEWNEAHHLAIMEALGGDELWSDRALAAHASLFYYWVCVVAYLISPSLAYSFSELVEGHATDTYAQFLDDNEEALKALAPPRVALEYYAASDLYYFDALVTRAGEPVRRPVVQTLYDVFACVRDDEGEHIRTMAACRGDTLAAELAALRAEGGRRELGSGE